MKIAIGPFDNSQGADWVIHGAESLAPEFEILAFASSVDVPRAEVVVNWSPEYYPLAERGSARAFVAVLSDWHVNLPDLSRFDLIATDWNGTRKLREMGYPEHKLLWLRLASHDPRLHYLSDQPPAGLQPNERDIDVAFCGRPSPHRESLLNQVRSWGETGGRNVHIETTPYRRGHEAEVYRRAKVVVNWSVRGELNMRTFEAAACGALTLTEQGNMEALRTDYPVAWWGFSLLADQLDYWLTHDQERLSLALQQHAWAQRERPVDHLSWLCREVAERLPATDRPANVMKPAAQQSGPNAPLEQRDATPSTNEPTQDQQRREVAMLVPDSAQHILDLGCNVGGLAWWLKQQALAGNRAEVFITGVDADHEKLDLAVRLERLDRGFVADLDAPERLIAEELEPESLDCVVMADVLEHLKSPDLMLQRLHPLLKKDGCIVVSIPNGLLNIAILHDLVVGGDFPYYRAGRDPFLGPPSNLRTYDHIRWYTAEGVARLLRENGYQHEHGAVTKMTESDEMTRFADDLADLVQRHGGNPDALKAAAYVCQFVIRARPVRRLAL
ncbi:MAG: hypothetical protein CL878_11395 [Dehalococcoidia bacterium]|nr:hypothetical protein [Dehalococcoidia bacterium]